MRSTQWARQWLSRAVVFLTMLGVGCGLFASPIPAFARLRNASSAQAPTQSTSTQRTWQTRYTHRPATITYPPKADAGGGFHSFAFGIRNSLNVTTPGFTSGVGQYSPTISVDPNPANATSATPSAITASTDNLNIDLTTTSNGFGTTAPTVGSYALTNPATGTALGTDFATTPNALYTRFGTTSTGFVTFAAVSNSTGSNGIGLYSYTASGGWVTTPKTVIAYADSGSGNLLQYSSPRLAFDSTSGALYISYVLSEFQRQSDPNAYPVYLRSDVYLVRSTNNGTTWSSPVAVSRGVPTSPTCVPIYSSDATTAPCDDVYYPSPVVARTGDVWVAFICNCVDTPPNTSTSRGQYMLSVVSGGTTPNSPTYATPLDDSTAATALANANFYLGPQGNLAYDPNRCSSSCPDNGLLFLSFAHKTATQSPGGQPLWSVNVSPLLISSTNTITSLTASSINVAGSGITSGFFPWVTIKPTTAVTTPVDVGYYTWNGTALAYSVSQRLWNYTTGFSGSISTATVAAATTDIGVIGNYLGEYTGLDANFVTNLSIGTNGRIFASYTGSGTVGDPDQFVVLVNKS